MILIRFLAVAGSLLPVALPVKATLIVLAGSDIFESDQTTPVTQGSLISVGYFDDAFSDYAGLPGRDWLDITASDFTELFNSAINPNGTWAGTSTESAILGKQLYVWIFDAPSAPTTVNDVEYGLYSGSTAEWTAKGDDLAMQNSLNVNGVDIALHGTALGGGNLALAPVPEPPFITTAAGGLVVLLMAMRRFRKARLAPVGCAA